VGPGNKLSGRVEADETFIGGKARNMHAEKRARRITGTGGKDTAAVPGILGQGNKTTGEKVRTKVVGNIRKGTLQAEVRERVLAGSALFTEPFHLFRYLDEQAFRYNNRVGFEDGGRFDLAVRQIVGKRLTFDQLTGNDQPEWRLGQPQA